MYIFFLSESTKRTHYENSPSDPIMIHDFAVINSSQSVLKSEVDSDKPKLNNYFYFKIFFTVFFNQSS